jgi:hypothetical protein
MVAALMAVEDRIKQSYPHAVRTGWRAACDSLTVYFTAYTARPPAVAHVVRAA